jgi:hypothetical protein
MLAEVHSAVMNKITKGLTILEEVEEEEEVFSKNVMKISR